MSETNEERAKFLVRCDQGAICFYSPALGDDAPLFADYSSGDDREAQEAIASQAQSDLAEALDESRTQAINGCITALEEKAQYQLEPGRSAILSCVPVLRELRDAKAEEEASDGN